jgi:hypothetical protein
MQVLIPINYIDSKILLSHSNYTILATGSRLEGFYQGRTIYSSFDSLIPEHKNLVYCTGLF